MLTIDGEEWLTSSEAVELLSLNHGRQIPGGYLRKLAHLGRVRTHYIDARTPLYLRVQIEGWRIADRPGRQPADNPSPTAERVRRSRARRRAAPGSTSPDDRPGPALCACGESISQPWCCARRARSSPCDA